MKKLNCTKLTTLHTCLLHRNEVVIKKNCTSAFDKRCDLIELRRTVSLNTQEIFRNIKMNKHANIVAFSLFTNCNSSLTLNYMIFNTQQY